MKALTRTLLEDDRALSGEHFHDKLMDLVDKNEDAAQLLDDTTYVIAGMLNGGLQLIADSPKYYRHYQDSVSFLGRSARSYYDQSGPVGKFVEFMMNSSRAINEYRENRRDDDDDDFGPDDFKDSFMEVADPFEDWLYNNDNLEALCKSLIDLYHKAS